MEDFSGNCSRGRRATFRYKLCRLSLPLLFSLPLLLSLTSHLSNSTIYTSISYSPRRLSLSLSLSLNFQPISLSHSLSFMEAREEPMNSSSSSEIHSAVVKGRRTKRPRISHSTISHEEEDLALCLILLAQGCTKSREGTEHNGKSSVSLYECKTCNKSFPSFQALGGHRSSHKKPKVDQAEEKREIEDNFRMNNYFPASEVHGKAIRVHECSICRLEFSSGQALGGHMRRHRATAPPTAAAPLPIDQKEKNSGFSLDLNLPAPSDEEREHYRDFVFSASALVDCHY